MPTSSKRTSTVSGEQAFDEVAAFLVGGGIITMALFPFALPVILLVTIPLIPIVLVAAVAGAILAAPVLLFRLARRLLGRDPGRGSRPVAAPGHAAFSEVAGGGSAAPEAYTAAKPVRQLG